MHAPHFACARGCVPGTAAGHAPLFRSHAPKQTPLPASSYDRTFDFSSLSIHFLPSSRDDVENSSNEIFSESRTNWTATFPIFPLPLPLLLVLPPFRRQRSCKDGGFATRRTRNLRHAVQYYTEGEYFTAGQVQRKRRHRRYGTRRRILNRS